MYPSNIFFEKLYPSNIFFEKLYPSNITFKNTIFLMLSMTSFNTIEGFSFQRKQVFIEVFNNLGEGLDLYVYCEFAENSLAPI